MNVNVCCNKRGIARLYDSIGCFHAHGEEYDMAPVVHRYDKAMLVTVGGIRDAARYPLHQQRSLCWAQLGLVFVGLLGPSIALKLLWLNSPPHRAHQNLYDGENK
jgi:hypothetical protein